MTDTAPGRWDGPWYRVRTDRLEADFLPDAGEDPEDVCDVDVEVRLPDGSRWTATVFTLAEVEKLMQRSTGSDEALGGRYFWVSDGLIVRDPGVSAIVGVLEGLLDNGDFASILQRLDRPPSTRDSRIPPPGNAFR
ncbi:hypothetical protein ACQPXB_38415 [Amycolatopsis sp. CA-161197]|uniref:hypothetical protein n=1 Tax=Amycolatopsis sp. CA-161197 TaxID=3239922 RepID=UPI003D91E980